MRQPALSEVEGKSLGFVRRAFCCADTEIFRLRGVYPERSEGLRFRTTTRQVRLYRAQVSAFPSSLGRMVMKSL